MPKESIHDNTPTLLREKQITEKTQSFITSLTPSFLESAKRTFTLQKRYIKHEGTAVLIGGAILFVATLGSGVHYHKHVPPTSTATRVAAESVYTPLPYLTPTLTVTREPTFTPVPSQTLSSIASVTPSPTETLTPTHAVCTFTQGFKVLADTLKKEGIDVGTCVGSVRSDNQGNTYQKTTQGELKWTKKDNKNSFTDKKNHIYPEATPTEQPPFPFLTPLANPISLAQSHRVFTVHIDYPMTTDQIIAYIKQKFGTHAQEAIIVATCESGLRPDIVQVNENNDGSDTIDYGVFQINSIHQKELGTQFETDPKRNIEVALALYDENGLAPWDSSKRCWSPELNLRVTPTPTNTLTTTPLPVINNHYPSNVSTALSNLKRTASSTHIKK